jgi:hypothetical protein
MLFGVLVRAVVGMTSGPARPSTQVGFYNGKVFMDMDQSRPVVRRERFDFLGYRNFLTALL